MLSFFGLGFVRFLNVIHCAKMHEMFHENWIYESYINSAWVVSQYENEYNPLHNHTGCEISGVIYLKTPNVKNRRNLESKKGKDDNDGDFEPTFAQTADADDVTVTANGDTEILDLHWITVKKP